MHSRSINYLLCCLLSSIPIGYSRAVTAHQSIVVIVQWRRRSEENVVKFIKSREKARERPLSRCESPSWVKYLVLFLQSTYFLY